MMRQTTVLLSGLLATTMFTATAHATVGHSYLGPTPYLSQADSPFVLNEFGVCLETFEDGTLDVPDVTGNGSVVGPGGLVDSVDGDDGSIDGSGTNGHSYFTGDGADGITFTFKQGRPNGYPTFVGIVWTDGGAGTEVNFEAFDASGNSFGVYGPFSHADNSNSGETAEDRFYGVKAIDGVSKIKISNPSGGIEVDHLQLDRCVVCGDANQDMHVTASDALIALKTAVNSSSCLGCICDTNNSSKVTTSDALTILKNAVGSSIPMTCPSCDWPPPL